MELDERTGDIPMFDFNGKIECYILQGLAVPDVHSQWEVLRCEPRSDLFVQKKLPQDGRIMVLGASEVFLYTREGLEQEFGKIQADEIADYFDHIRQVKGFPGYENISRPFVWPKDWPDQERNLARIEKLLKKQHKVNVIPWGESE